GGLPGGGVVQAVLLADHRGGDDPDGAGVGATGLGVAVADGGRRGQGRPGHLGRGLLVDTLGVGHPVDALTVLGAGLDRQLTAGAPCAVSPPSPGASAAAWSVVAAASVGCSGAAAASGPCSCGSVGSGSVLLLLLRAMGGSSW